MKDIPDQNLSSFVYTYNV